MSEVGDQFSALLAEAIDFLVGQCLLDAQVETVGRAGNVIRSKMPRSALTALMQLGALSVTTAVTLPSSFHTAMTFHIQWMIFSPMCHSCIASIAKVNACDFHSL